VSPISVFEVTVLHVAGALRVRQPLEQWIRGGLEHVRLAEFSSDMAIDAGYIPRDALTDPADRILGASARQLDATLVTADRAILAYARGGHVRVQDASK
jgi:PIN domain nuclease of toxin-antitoxin system